MGGLSFLVLLWGCSGETPSDTAVDTDTDTDTDTGAEEAPREVWSDETLGLTDITTRLHDDIGAIVYVTWQQDAAATDVTVEFSVDDGEWRSAPAQDTEAGEVSFMLLGIPYATTFSYRIRAGEQTSATHEADSGHLPDGMPLPELLGADEAEWVADDRYLITTVNEKTGGWTGGGYWRVIIDRQARVVWAQLTPDSHWSIFARISHDGDDLLFDEATFWSDFDTGRGSQIHRMKIDGSIVETVGAPGLHHAFVELPGGTLVWGAADFSTEDLVKRDPGGEVETIWRCEDFHDSIGVKNNCQSNTLAWHEPSDSFIYSFYTTSTVLQVDHQTGETLRYWGQLGGPWSFSPEESLFEWQHGVYITDDGTLLLSTHTTTGALETVVREYTIDDKTQTLSQIWSFGVGEGVHAATAGEAHRLTNGNTLHNYGSDARLREVTTDGQIVWEVSWPHGGFGRLIGRSIFTDSLYNFAP